jgi:hypothetical protein
VNRLLELLDDALDHVGRFLRGELEVSTNWKITFFLQLIIQSVLGGVVLITTGGFPVINLALAFLFGLIVVGTASDPSKNRKKYCRGCGRRMIPRVNPVDGTRTIPACPQSVPKVFDLVVSPYGVSCDETVHALPLYHQPHDPYMPDIDCVPCLIDMELSGAITGKEVDRRIKKLMAS